MSDVGIEKDGIVTVESIFVFRSYVEINEFLKDCKARNVSACFLNEQWTITPEEVGESYTNAKVSAYAMICSYPKAAEDYLKYLCTLPEKMAKEKGSNC